jgi:NAD(P)-dependent dehydrogenase (short-subunit alcohol dehydrogenase family)
MTMADRRVIAVTGASRGIGSAIAEELAQRGYVVGCLSRKGEGMEDRKPADDMADRLIPFACDLLDEASIKSAIGGLARTTGRLDGLVNNAGLHLEGPSAEFATTDFERVMRTNVTGIFVTCREAFPFLLKGEQPTIINIGSFFQNLGAKLNLAYSASKAAVGGLTRGLAVEWAEHGISVLNVAPGFVATDLNREYMRHEAFRRFLANRIPVGSPCPPEEVARLVGALFDENLPFLTGETIVIDGGQTINQ